MLLWAQMDRKSTLANILSGKSGYEVSGSSKVRRQKFDEISILNQK